MTYTTCLLEEIDSNSTKSQIIELFHQNSTPDPEQRFDWLYRSEYSKNNHIHQALLHKNKLVGIASCLRVPTTNQVLGSFVNLLVEEKHRTLGPALTLEKQIIQSCCQYMHPDVLIVRPNKKAAPLYKRLKFSPLDVSPRHTWIINPSKFIELPALIQHASGTTLKTLITPYLWIQTLTLSMKSPDPVDGKWKFYEDIKDADQLLPDYHIWRYIQIPGKAYKLATFGNLEYGDPFIVFHISKSGTLSIIDIFNIKNASLDWLLSSFMLHCILKYTLRNFSVNFITPTQAPSILTRLGYLERLEKNGIRTLISQCPNSNRSKLSSSSILLPSRLDF